MKVDIGYVFLILAELFIIALVFIIRAILKKHESKKVDKILSFIDMKSQDKEVNDKFKECIEIIKQNNENMK